MIGAACGALATAVAAQRVMGVMARALVLQRNMLIGAAGTIAALQQAMVDSVQANHDALVAIRLAAEDDTIDIREDLDGMILGLADGLAVMGEHRA